jgi:hypothetical protein
MHAHVCPHPLLLMSTWTFSTPISFSLVATLSHPAMLFRSLAKPVQVPW